MDSTWRPFDLKPRHPFFWLRLILTSAHYRGPSWAHPLSPARPWERQRPDEGPRDLGGPAHPLSPQDEKGWDFHGWDGTVKPVVNSLSSAFGHVEHVRVKSVKIWAESFSTRALQHDTKLIWGVATKRKPCGRWTSYNMFDRICRVRRSRNSCTSISTGFPCLSRSE